MNKLLVQGVVLFLMLAALPLTSVGTTTSLQWLAYLGLASLAIGAVTMPILRFAGSEDSDDGDGEDTGTDDGDDGAGEDTGKDKT